MPKPDDEVEVIRVEAQLVTLNLCKHSVSRCRGRKDGWTAYLVYLDTQIVSLMHQRAEIEKEGAPVIALPIYEAVVAENERLKAELEELKK